MHEDARVKVCDRHMVESLTAEGWVVREVRDVEEIGSPPGGKSVRDQYGCDRWEQFPPERVRSLAFILGRSRDVELDAARSELRIVHANVRDLKNEIATAKKTAETEKKRADEAEALVKTLRADLDRGLAARDELNARIRKFEADIARIRAEVGEGRMREILAVKS